MGEQLARELESKRGMAAALRVAACLVYDEPDEGTIRGYAESRMFEGAPFDASDDALERGLSMMGSWCRSAEGDGFSEAVGALRREHLRLFVGCGTPLAPSWATYYSDPNQQLFGRETLEVREAYREFGLAIERLRAEPDDHLGLMMRFLAYLLEAECDEAERGDAAEARRLSEAQEEFLAAHVLPWVPVWAYSGRRSASSDYYRGCVEFVFGLLREYAASFGISYREDPPSFVRRQRSED